MEIFGGVPPPFDFHLCFFGGGQKLQEEVPAFNRESIRREIVPMFQRFYWLHFPETDKQVDEFMMCKFWMSCVFQMTSWLDIFFVWSP